MSSTFFFLVKFNSDRFMSGWAMDKNIPNIQLDKILYLHHEINNFFTLSYQSTDMSYSSVIQKSSSL